MRILLITFLGMTLSYHAQGQYDLKYPHQLKVWNDKLNLKVDLMNALNPVDPSLLFALENYLAANLSTNHEIGPVLGFYDSEAVIYELPLTYPGFKTRHGIRLYTGKNQRLERGYIEGSIQYRHLNVGEGYTMGYDCNSWGNCQYYRYYRENLKTDRWVYQVRVGVESHLSERLLFEADIGLGLQHHVLHNMAEGRLIGVASTFSSDDFEKRPYVSVSMKLGYVIRFKKESAPDG